MLDERQVKAVEAKAKGATITDVAKEVGVSRNTIYAWMILEDFKAELSRLEQDFLSSTKQAVISYGPIVVEELKKLATKGKSEKIRLDALSKLLDKTMSNATKIELNDSRDDGGAVPVDVITQAIEDMKNE